MKISILAGAVVTLGSILAAPATAGEADGDQADQRAQRRQSILEEFDADGDGELNDEERRTARETMRERRHHHGRRHFGPGRRGGAFDRHGGPPEADQVFDHFDHDGDGLLSREEFRELAQHVRRMREEIMSRVGRGPEGFGRRPAPGEGPILGQRFGPPRGERFGRRRPGPAGPRGRDRKQCADCDKPGESDSQSDR